MKRWRRPAPRLDTWSPFPHVVPVTGAPRRGNPGFTAIMTATLIALILALTWATLAFSVAQAGGEPRRETSSVERARVGITVKNGRLTANVTEAPLEEVIEQIARQSRLRIVLHASG